MTWAIRTMALTAGAAALLSAQVAVAAPARTGSIDPLVALSALGTLQSQSEVCSAAGAAQSNPNCVLPVQVPPAAGAPIPPPPPPALVGAAPKAISPVVALLGVLAVVALAAALASGGGKGSGDLTPVSPD